MGNEEKRRAIFDKHRFNADLLILLETHSEESIEKIWEHEWGGKAAFSHGTPAARGVAIFTSKEIFNKITNIESSPDGRFLIFDIMENGLCVTIAAIYALNNDSPEFFKNIEQKLKDRHEHKILLGDFNLVLDVNMDRENTYNNNNKAKDEVLEIMDQYYLQDTWRIQNEEKREFSWIKRGSFPIKASRIDFALISAGLSHLIEMIQYISSIKTDHRAVYLVIKFNSFQRGAGFWKLNCTMLRERQYIESIKQEIQQTLQASSQKTPSKKWEILKKRIKQKSIDYSKAKSSENRQIISQLSEKVNEYESNLPLVREQYELLEKTKMDLEEKTMERIQGVMFRSRVKWYEEGEQNTKYFFSLEKARYNAKTCYKIIKEDGTELNQPSQIIDEQRQFYRKLYQEDNHVNFTWKNTFGIQVPDNIREQQDTQITMSDLEAAIKTMNNNKTPGMDGIPVDFYKIFWSDIKQTFQEMMLESYQRHQLHETAREGVLNLIPKTNKDSRFIKNLRPITLLNTDYNIIEKAIANKMIPALEHIINKDQRGFMKERRISVNIRKMLDIIGEAKKEDLEGVFTKGDAALVYTF